MKTKLLIRLLPAYASVLLVFLLLVALGNHAVNVITEAAPVKDRSCIIIDAGHGGIDGGATSCTGVLESKLNLEVALRLEDLLHLMGIDTIMIRNTDCSVYTEGETIAAQKVSDLKNRVTIVNRNAHALLLSIHQNYFGSSKYCGAQIFYNKHTDSKQLAADMQYAFTETINKGSRRKAKAASGIYLMDHIRNPGILIECGFLSNPSEEHALRTPEYQKKLCCIIAGVSAQYLHRKIS